MDSAKLEDFTKQPSISKLKKMTVTELCKVADFYKIYLSSADRKNKRTCMRHITQKLNEEGLFALDASSDDQSDDNSDTENQGC